MRTKVEPWHCKCGRMTISEPAGFVSIACAVCGDRFVSDDYRREFAPVLLSKRRDSAGSDE